MGPDRARRGASRPPAGGRRPWQEDRPNAMCCRLMRQLGHRQPRRVALLTATPAAGPSHRGLGPCCCRMLGLPPEWTEDALPRLLRGREKPNPSRGGHGTDARDCFRPGTRVRRAGNARVQRLADRRAARQPGSCGRLRDGASIPRRRLETAGTAGGARRHARHTPVRRARLAPTRRAAARLLRKECWPRRSQTAACEDRFVEMRYI